MQDLDARLLKILAPFEIQTTRTHLLSCSRCCSDTSYTYRGLCGPCFLFGDLAKPSDFRTPTTERQPT